MKAQTTAVAQPPWGGWDFSVRVWNVFREQGISSPDVLAGMSFLQLRKLWKLGNGSLCEIREEMARHGMHLVGEEVVRGAVGPRRGKKAPAYVSRGGEIILQKGDFVYVLMADGQPIYAGASTNLLLRIATHVADGKVFNAVLWQRTPPGMRFVVERWLIRGLQPPLNRAGLSRVTRG